MHIKPIARQLILTNNEVNSMVDPLDYDRTKVVAAYIMNHNSGS